jgi:hypothetical protein
LLGHAPAGVKRKKKLTKEKSLILSVDSDLNRPLSDVLSEEKKLPITNKRRHDPARFALYRIRHNPQNRPFGNQNDSLSPISPYSR